MHNQLGEDLEKIISGIVDVEKNDINNENANMSSMTPAGQMMRFASEVSKMYTLENLVSPEFKEAHNNGEIHIHDLEYYPSKTWIYKGSKKYNNLCHTGDNYFSDKPE